MEKRKSKSNGLFKPPKWRYLAEIVSFRTPSDARKSARKLISELRKAKRKDKALRICRAIQYASNRAKAASRNPRISWKEKRELREIAEIYGEAAEEAWEIYREKFGGD